MILGLGISAYICYSKAKTVIMHDVRLLSNPIAHILHTPHSLICSGFRIIVPQY